MSVDELIDILFIIVNVCGITVLVISAITVYIRKKKNKETSYMADEAITDYYDELDNILEDWCREAGIDDPVGYYWTGDFNDRTLAIYTDSPSYLIGGGGALFKKYTKIIKERYKNVKHFSIVEVKKFVNYLHLDAIYGR